MMAISLHMNGQMYQIKDKISRGILKVNHILFTRYTPTTYNYRMVKG